MPVTSEITTLTDAIVKDDMVALARLVQAKHDLNKQSDLSCDSALETAILWEREAAVNLLLRLKAEVNFVSPGGLRPLTLLVECYRNREDSVAEGDQSKLIRIAESLLAAKALIDAMSPLNKTPADPGGNRNLLSTMTALSCASQYECMWLVDMLLRSNASVDLAHEGRKTALSWAVVKGNSKLARALLVAGADPARAARLSDTRQIRIKKAEYLEPQKKIVTRVPVDVVKKIKAGLRVLLQEKAACFRAAERGELGQLTESLQLGWSVAMVKATTGATLLYVAAKAGRVEVVRYLLSQGANTETQHGNGKTALQAAHINIFMSRVHREGVVRLLQPAESGGGVVNAEEVELAPVT